MIAGEDVAEEIVGCVDRRPNTTLWMATHARSRVGGLFLGSTSEAVVRQSRRPIVLVGPRTRVAPPAGPVVVYVGESPPSLELLAAARQWAERLRCPLRLVTPGRDRRAPNDKAPASLRVEQQFAGDGVMVDAEILTSGGPAQAIEDYADRESAALLVMTTHAREGVSRAVLGSMTMAVVHRARCPVLVQVTRNSAP